MGGKAEEGELKQFQWARKENCRHRRKPGHLFTLGMGSEEKSLLLSLDEDAIVNSGFQKLCFAGGLDAVSFAGDAMGIRYLRILGICCLARGVALNGLGSLRANMCQQA